MPLAGSLAGWEQQRAAILAWAGVAPMEQGSSGSCGATGTACGGRPGGRRVRHHHLLSSHNRTQAVGSELQWSGGGRLVRLKVPCYVPFSGGGRRGCISHYSRGSYKRLLDKLNGLDQREMVCGVWRFITLTFHLAVPPPREAKKMLKAFRRAYEAAFGRICGFWKLEPQERGAPHFHLLIMRSSQGDVQAEINWVAHKWHEIAGAGSAYHLALALGQLPRSKPCVEVVDKFEAVVKYVGKYMAKPIDGAGWDRPGRWWGTWRDEMLPRTILREAVNDEVARLMRRQIVRAYEHQPTGRYCAERVRFNGQLERVRTFDDKKTFILSQDDRRPMRMSAIHEQIGYRISKRYKRRWRQSAGSVSMYMSDRDVERLLAWAKAEAAGKVVGSDTVAVGGSGHAVVGQAGCVPPEIRASRRRVRRRVHEAAASDPCPSQGVAQKQPPPASAAARILSMW